MKLAGVIMILISAAGGYLIHRRSEMQILRLLYAIAEDLALLRCQICVHRRPLPLILSDELNHGPGGEYLWRPLVDRLARSEGTVCACWEDSVAMLPEALAARLTPLGRLLSVGGDTLACAIDEVREEILALARTQQAEQGAKLRLSAAMCFSAAALFILVFL